MKRNTFFLSILFFSIFIFSCATASGSYVLTGKQKTETTSDKVQIYTELPPEYEIIGIVTATSAATGDKQKDLNYAIDELKIQAAKIGANGIIIDSIGSSTSGGIVMYNMVIPIEAQNVSAKAIYVPE